MTQNDEQIKKLLADCAAALSCPAGEFYPDKTYGSFISRAYEKGSEYILACARHALTVFDGVFVISAENDTEDDSDDSYDWTFNLLINDTERQVSVHFEYDI